MGCDGRGVFGAFSDSVSIHAPVWGATYMPYLVAQGYGFQSTHPCGVRPVTRNFVMDCQSFNPRTRVGCDYSNLINLRQLNSFNPRTRVGCDCTRQVLLIARLMFQSTHPCGVRLIINRVIFTIARFNPRTRVGCDIFKLR